MSAQSFLVNDAAEVDISGVYENASFEFVMSFYEDDDYTPIVLTGAWKMTISRDPDGADVSLILKEGSGITQADNTLTFRRNRLQNSLKAKHSYWYSLQPIYDDNTGSPIMYGRFTVLSNTNK